MKFDQAFAIAQRLCRDFAPACERIAIAGSIRRQRPDVNDIDLILQPSPLMGASISASMKVLCSTVEIDGGKIKRGMLPEGIPLDVYVADDDTFEGLLLIRTGSAEHNVMLTTMAKNRGWKLQASGRGLADSHGTTIARNETDIFNALGLPYVEPQDREIQQGAASSQ